MTTLRRLIGVGSAVACTTVFALPASAVAQQAAPSGCPVEGAAIRLAPGTGRVRQPAVQPASIDTTLVLDGERRRWSRQDVTAAAEAAVEGTYPASWHACAGASVRLGRATVEMEGVEGRVHLRATLEPLMAVLRARQPRAGENPGREEP